MTAQSQFPKTHGMNLALGVFLGLTGVALLFDKAARGDLRLLAEIGMSYCGLVSWLLHRAKSAKHPGQWDVLPRTGTASPGLNNDVRSRTALTSAEIFSSV